MAGMRSRSSKVPFWPPGLRSGSRTRVRMARATKAVMTASPQIDPRQPKASTAIDSGRDDPMFPRLPMPTVAPARVPKTAGAKLRAKM